jgi:hypothetical protein
MAGKAGRSGKKSAEALSVVAEHAIGPARAEAPDHLTPDQAEEWRRVVDACASDWFPAETHGTLEGYCRHTVSVREIDALVEEVKAGDGEPIEKVGALDKLLKMRDREGRAAMAHARSLRITNQALTNHKKDRSPQDGGGQAKKPWQV